MATAYVGAFVLYLLADACRRVLACASQVQFVENGGVCSHHIGCCNIIVWVVVGLWLYALLCVKFVARDFGSDLV